VLVPFGGGRDEWSALELGAWLARAHGLPLRLLGVEATGGRRDASRVLASASLALQRFTGTAAEPVLVPPGADGILRQEGSILVASLGEELDSLRSWIRLGESSWIAPPFRSSSSRAGCDPVGSRRTTR
jgi:hypothetical protein